MITNKGKTTKYIKSIQNINKVYQVYSHKIDIENVFLNTSKEHFLNDFKEKIPSFNSGNGTVSY